jgi:putative DNA primase/helicase
VHQRNFTFKVSHTLLATTNYIPVVSEVDHGTWRRLALLQFPYTFLKRAADVVRTTDRLGDPRLKHRIENNLDGQHDAIITWIVEGAIRWYKDGQEALQPPAWVVRATGTWRATADRILGFWQDCLTADRDACILADEMLGAFNEWIKGNGHNQWSRESFAPRFESHMETTKYGVESRRMRNPKGVSRWSANVFEPLRAIPEKVWVWRGVRFRTTSDQDEDDFRAEWAESKHTFQPDPRAEKVANDSAHSARAVSDSDDDESATSPDVDAPPTCCGVLGPGRRGDPLSLYCKLCERSPTYHKKGKSP